MFLDDFQHFQRILNDFNAFNDLWIPLLENTKVTKIAISYFLIDMKFISKRFKIVYGDLNHFRRKCSNFQLFKVSKCQNIKIQKDKQLPNIQ